VGVPFIARWPGKITAGKVDKTSIFSAVDLLPTFCEIAGYTLDELIGEPHNIVRHPDMPRIAFKGLWDDIQTKGFWTGIVKNLRKDRSCYWVYATALKRVNAKGEVSYLSIRTVPNRSDVEACIPLYAELKSKE